jgi:tight adherence protein B
VTSLSRRVGILRSGAIVALVASCLVLPATSAAAQGLSGSIGAGAKFPARTMVLSAPAGVQVNVPHMYIWENGGPVDHLSVTPLTRANSGDFGVELVIDESNSMAGAPLAQALAAARALAAQRTGNQGLGVIGFNSAAFATLPLTSDSSVIDHVLSTVPQTSSGTRIAPALSLAISQLKTAGIADGAVILLSDGAATGSTGPAAVKAVAAEAKRQHVQILTIGLRDRAYAPALLRELAAAAGGRYIAATGAQLPHLFTSIGTSLTHSYLIRYDSIVPTGHEVAVKVHVDGVPSLLHLSYLAPAAATAKPTTATPTPAATAPPAPTVTSAAPTQRFLAGIPELSPVPEFATAVTGQQSPLHPQQIPGYKPVATQQTFWSSSAAALVVAGVCALLLVLALMIVLSRHSGRDNVQRRIGTFVDAGHLDSTDPLPEPGPLERLLTKRPWWQGFVESMQAARIERSPVELIKRSAVMALVIAVVLALLTGVPILGLPVLVLAPFVVHWRVARGARRQRKLFAEHLPANLQDLAGAIRAGRSFVGAIGVVAETSSEPIKGELERALRDEQLGLPLEDTLAAIGQRMESKDMEQIALIAALHRNSGSNVAEALERVADGARDRADLAREMRALTGQARMSSWVLSALPPALLVGLSVIEPSYARPLLHTTLGVVLLVVATLMVIAGWAVMRRIVNPEV